MGRVAGFVGFVNWMGDDELLGQLSEPVDVVVMMTGAARATTKGKLPVVTLARVQKSVGRIPGARDAFAARVTSREVVHRAVHGAIETT